MPEHGLDRFSKGRINTQPPASVSICLTNLPQTFEKQKLVFCLVSWRRADIHTHQTQLYMTINLMCWSTRAEPSMSGFHRIPEGVLVR